jgi:hypothetical protein
MCAIILDLLKGVAIEILFLLRFQKRFVAPIIGMPRGTIAALPAQRKEKCGNSSVKWAFFARSTLK